MLVRVYLHLISKAIIVGVLFMLILILTTLSLELYDALGLGYPDSEHEMRIVWALVVSCPIFYTSTISAYSQNLSKTSALGVVVV